MPSGRPSTRGGYSAVTNPDRFTPTAIKDHYAKTKPELLVFGDQTGAASSAQIATANVEGFTVYTNGTGDTKIYGSINPGESGFWVLLDTLSGNDFYCSAGFHPWIKIETQSNASNLDVWLYRKYATY